MIAALHLHPEQVRYYAHSALNGFDTLDQTQAIQNAKDELAGLLAYLGRFADYSVPILGETQIEPWVRLEGLVGDVESDDLPNLKCVGSDL